MRRLILAAVGRATPLADHLDGLHPATCLLAPRSLWKGPIWASQLTTLLPPSTASATPFNLPRASDDPLRNQRFLLSVPTEQEIGRMNAYAALIEHLRFDESDAMHPYMAARLRFPKLKVFEYVARPSRLARPRQARAQTVAR